MTRAYKIKVAFLGITATMILTALTLARLLAI